MKNFRMSPSKIIAQMTAYGAVLGAIAGFFVGASILLPDVGLAFGIFASILLGASLGTLLGSIGGLFSGTAMALTTALFFREIHNPRLYRYSMGIITFIVTGLVFTTSEFFHDWTGSIVALISTLIAVQASQLAARKYMQEIDVRKTKEQYE